jgi:hypothetical protein
MLHYRCGVFEKEVKMVETGNIDLASVMVLWAVQSVISSLCGV